MKIINFLFFLYLSNIINNQNNFDAEYNCKENENEYSTSYDDNCFQTPPKNDILGNYLETYQDMHYLVGYVQHKYTNDKKKCTINIITKVNKKLGTEGINYNLIYKFGDIEQETNNMILTSDNSYPDGLSISCKIIEAETGNIVAKLEFEKEYFYWDNVKIEQDNKYENGQKGVIVELFGWPYEDIAQECEFLNVAGYMGVKIFEPNEAILTYDSVENGELNPWWYIHQPVSYKLNSRLGNKTQLKHMINKCRENNIRIYSDIIINNMVKNGNDMYNTHLKNDNTIYGSKKGSSGSPFWTTKGRNENNPYTNLKPVLEFPSVPFCASDFHCFKEINDLHDENQLNTGWVNEMVDLNTGKDYVQQRIADFITELVSIGISGVFINDAKYISPRDYTGIFKKLKENFGLEFPEDFISVLEFDFGEMKNMLMCENGEYSFSTSFNEKLINEGFSTDDIKKIKIWNSNFPNESPKCDGDIWKIIPERHIISLESQEDYYNNNSHENYIKHKDIYIHRNKTIELLQSKENNWKIKTIFSSYSLINNASGFPDGKSDCSKSESDAEECTKSVPYQKAYSPLSMGYDTGNSNNWKEGTYTRVHRDLQIINSIREWIGLNILSEKDLYEKERKKALECPEDKPYQIISTGACVEDCDLMDFFNNICIIRNGSSKAKETLIKKVESEVKENSGSIEDLLYNIIKNEKDYLFKNDVNDFSIQLTSSYNQNNRIYNNESTVELGDCENTLKRIYNISSDNSLIILKVEYYKEGLLIPIIEYELFHPTERYSLILDYCNTTKISISIPLVIDENNLNVYNTTSAYYTDICYPSTSVYSTDITLEDRKKEFISKNLSLCESNCIYKGYNTFDKKVECECEAKNKFISEKGIEKEQNLLNYFIDVKYNTNLDVLKCYKILFTKEGFIKNIGNFIIISIIILYISLINYFSAKGFNSFKIYLEKILKIKKQEDNNNKFHVEKIVDVNNVKEKKNFEKSLINDEYNNNILNNDIKKNSNIKNIIHTENEINSNYNNSLNVLSKKIVNFDNPLLSHLNNENISRNVVANNRYDSKVPKKKKIKIKVKRKRALDIGELGISSDFSSRTNNILIFSKNNNPNKVDRHESNKTMISAEKNQIEINKYYDCELNSLSYSQAIEKDKRTYCQFYISLLKTKHLLIFPFCIYSDYNPFIIKICIFLLALSIFLIINALFYTNSIIHGIYEEEGKYILKNHINNIILSAVISTVIFHLIKYFFTSDKIIIKIKNEKNSENLEDKIVNIFKCLVIKFTLFSDLSLLLLFLFWYYISCFCAVFKNSQSFLIKDTLYSLAFSLLYHFVINLIPGIFRIYALKKAKNNVNKELIFKIGTILQVL